MLSSTPLGFRFAQPALLYLLCAVPVAVAAAGLLARRRPAALRFSSVALLGGLPRTLRTRLTWLPGALRTITLCLLIVAAARPQFGFSSETVRSMGVDIILAVDLSDSMSFNDFRPHRLAVAKESMKEFVAGRPSDNIGVLGFGRWAAMLCPLTPEFDIVNQFIDKLNFKVLGEATAMGDAIMLSAKRLEKSPAKSKVIVLMTDGKNTAGTADPLKAAEVAAALGITIHTVGIGSNAPNNVFSLNIGTSEFDPETLQRIATTTGGSYFHATDRQKFDAIFTQIDAMEKTRLERQVNRDYEDRMAWFVWPAVVLAVADLLLRRTLLRRLPA